MNFSSKQNRSKSSAREYIVIGDPISHSRSPELHNALYREVGIENDYHFSAARVKVEELAQAIKNVRLINISGLAVTIPHKVSIIPLLDELDESASAIQAVNTVVNNQGKLIGYNSDWYGISAPIERMLAEKGGISLKKVALFGAGGAARAALFALKKFHPAPEIYLFNRSSSRAKELAKYYDFKFCELSHLALVSQCDLIINATSLGMSPNLEETPCPKQYLSSKNMVYDLVYTPKNTKLIQDAINQGAAVIYGEEMFIYQAKRQFLLFTGVDVKVENITKLVL
jgi:shikimate dehydrogenase